MSERKKTSIAIAVRTPMSLTRSARAPNSAASRAGRPNSLTSVAPGAEKRSVICDVIAALCTDASRSRRPTRLPMRRAGITNSGSRPSASRVIGHDRLNMTASVSTSVITFVTTPASADVNAPWAPMTSLFSRLTRAPVWVRVKKAIGIDWTCSNTRRRRSRIRRSPRRDDSRRSSRPTPAARTATTASSTAMPTTVAAVPLLDDGVDRPPREHRGEHAEQRGDGGQREERGDRAAVRPGELERPAARSAGRPGARAPSSCIALCSAFHIWKSDMALTLGPQVPLRSTSAAERVYALERPPSTAGGPSGSATAAVLTAVDAVARAGGRADHDRCRDRGSGNWSTSQHEVGSFGDG